jgi:hypothetical protein
MAISKAMIYMRTHNHYGYAAKSSVCKARRHIGKFISMAATPLACLANVEQGAYFQA